jgi:hypothetical protein
MRELSICLIVFVVIAGCGGCGGSDSGLTETQVDQLLEVQTSVQAEREHLSQQRDQLEADRRDWDARERIDPIIAAAIENAGLLVACGLPLLVVAILLWPRRSEPVDEELCDVLICDMTSDHPKLLPHPRSAKESPKLLK